MARTVDWKTGLKNKRYSTKVFKTKEKKRAKRKAKEEWQTLRDPDDRYDYEEDEELLG